MDYGQILTVSMWGRRWWLIVLMALSYAPLRSRQWPRSPHCRTQIKGSFVLLLFKSPDSGSIRLRHPGSRGKSGGNSPKHNMYNSKIKCGNIMLCKILCYKMKMLPDGHPPRIGRNSRAHFVDCCTLQVWCIWNKSQWILSNLLRWKIRWKCFCGTANCNTSLPALVCTNCHLSIMFGAILSINVSTRHVNDVRR